MYEKLTENLTDLVTKGAQSGASLLQMRDLLEKERGVDWRQFYEAVSRMPVDQLNDRQKRQLADLQEPPMDSLAWIFHDWKPSRITRSIKGKR